MNREFSVVIEKDEEGYFVASVPTLRGCHTQARSLDVLMKRIKEAIEVCLEGDKEAYFLHQLWVASVSKGFNY